MATTPEGSHFADSLKSDVFLGFPDDALATYLLRLPFNVALDPDQVHTIRVFGTDAPEGQGSAIDVDFRLLRLRTGGERYFPAMLTDAARTLNETDLDLDEPDALYAPHDAYETWVSAETPLRYGPGEPDYPARTLERCLRALWLLLTAYRLATRDQNVFPVGPASLNKWMVVGVKILGQPWQQLMTLLLRPESGIPQFPGLLAPEQLGAFGQAIELVSADHPFVRGKDLELAAYRQAYALDDLPAAVISLQTAMESTLFDLWRISLVDKGQTQHEIEEIAASDTNFKPLMTTVMPPILGGRWDVGDAQTPVGQYWQTLYRLRNDVIHSAANVQEWQYEAAVDAHKALIRFIAERLLERWRRLPRTLLAFGRARGLPEGLHPSRRAEESLAALASAAEPYWLAPER
jgi:hypothetical protein